MSIGIFGTIGSHDASLHNFLSSKQDGGPIQIDLGSETKRKSLIRIVENTHQEKLRKCQVG